MKNFITKYFLDSPRKVFLTGLVYLGVLVILTFALIVDFSVYWAIASVGVYCLSVFQKFLSDRQPSFYKTKYVDLVKSLKDRPHTKSKYFIADQETKEEMFLSGELKQERGNQ